MKIGINLLAVVSSVNGGVEVYVRNLLRGLRDTDGDHEYYLFTNSASEDRFKIHDPRFHTVHVAVRGHRRPSRVIWEQIYLPFAAKRAKLDVLHSPSYTWPVLSDIPGVVTIHDMLYAVYPEYVAQPKLTFWRTLVPWSARKCRRIITVSENSKQDIVRHLKIPEEKVVVTAEALDAGFSRLTRDFRRTERVLAKYNVRTPYILNVGGCAIHKNAAVLIRALKELRSIPEAEGLSVVIVGKDNGARRRLERLSETLGMRSAVTFTGYVDDLELADLYRAAAVYASPSYFEGFGLTVLEAMASGVPVIVSDRGSLPEVVGDAALVVDPDSQEEVVLGIRRLLRDERLCADLQKKARVRLQSYSWTQASRLTLQAYEQTAAGAPCLAERRSRASV